MGKKSRSARPQPKPAPSPVPAGEPITSLGWRIVSGGALLVAAGFIVLSRADPLGANWAAKLSPFLILGGYGVAAAGIFAPESLAPGTPADSGPEAPPAS
ncbi:MAG: hypothetical protein PHF00_00345 [Elusimicrobia bacterium]|nr:hypothetical protein [Elusimicrobiota bacterium]